MIHSPTRRSPSLPILSGLLIVPAVCGWLIGAAWIHWPTISDVWYEASVQRYLTMTGQVGPVTYLVTHDDFRQLQASVAPFDDVLGIELHRYPDVAAIAFREGGVDDIERVSELAQVTDMRQAFVPMMCH